MNFLVGRVRVVVDLDRCHLFLSVSGWVQVLWHTDFTPEESHQEVSDDIFHGDSQVYRLDRWQTDNFVTMASEGYPLSNFLLLRGCQDVPQHTATHVLFFDQHRVVQIDTHSARIRTTFQLLQIFHHLLEGCL